MAEDARLRPQDYRPAPPPEAVRTRYGIGVVGCGGIARGSHLPAYRDFGYRVVAACDISAEHARGAAEQFSIPFWTTELDALLARPDVDVIDLAVHASQRRPLVERIAAAGKPILSQKPFALTWDDARHMVEVCERAGVPLMVNQQARWAPAHRALKRVIDSGVLGHVYSVLHVRRSFQDQPGSWYVQLPHFTIVDHGIHFIDLTRYFTGRTPLRVKATTTRMPGQVAVTPMIYSIQLEYATSPAEADLMTTLHFNNIVQARSMFHNTWYVDGTAGAASVTDTELTLSTKEDPDRVEVIPLQGTWFPEAFGGSMGEMLASLAEGRPPATAGRDNLDSIRIALAAIASAESGRTVALADVSAPAPPAAHPSAGE